MDLTRNIFVLLYTRGTLALRGNGYALNYVTKSFPQRVHVIYCCTESLSSPRLSNRTGDRAVNEDPRSLLNLCNLTLPASDLRERKDYSQSNCETSTVSFM